MYLGDSPTDWLLRRQIARFLQSPRIETMPSALTTSKVGVVDEVTSPFDLVGTRDS
jgi:hypothetical protein